MQPAGHALTFKKAFDEVAFYFAGDAVEIGIGKTVTVRMDDGRIFTGRLRSVSGSGQSAIFHVDGDPVSVSRITGIQPEGGYMHADRGRGGKAEG